MFNVKMTTRAFKLPKIVENLEELSTGTQHYQVQMLTQYLKIVIGVVNQYLKGSVTRSRRL